MKTFYLLVPEKAVYNSKVGFYYRKKRARNDRAVRTLCCANAKGWLIDAEDMLGRKNLEPGIHTVRFVIEPQNRRLP